MSSPVRSLAVILLAALLAGCGVAPSPSVTTSPGPTVSPSASAAQPSTVPSVPHSPSPSPSPTSTGSGSPSPLAAGGFVTPLPPDPAAAWLGIAWRKVPLTDPLAHVRSVTRWSGGFVATGDLVVTNGQAYNRVWVSSDGGRWQPLGANVFGPAAIVVGVAPMAGGVAALTLQSGTYLENGSATDLGYWTLTGPWQSWTSSNGTTWTAHPGPAFSVPQGMTGYAQGHPTLVAGAGSDLLAITFGGGPLAFSPDGIAWQTVSLDAFPGGPAGWRAADIAAWSPGFVTVGSSPTKSVALASLDGRAWTSSDLPTTCPAGQLTIGSAGMIMTSSVGDPHTPVAVWCSSLDGRTWQGLPKYPPLGVSTAENECRGVCSNGILLGNGERMIAYRGYPAQAGWTSFDGRSWRALAFTGSRPTGWTEPGGYQFAEVVAPFGLLFIDADSGSVWLGTPRT